jgi:hypothetical protein
MIRCRYCGTEVADVQALEGHRQICDKNPAGAAFDPQTAPWRSCETEHLTCHDCHYERAGGACADPTCIGGQVTSVGPRLCYDERPDQEEYRIAADPSKG